MFSIERLCEALSKVRRVDGLNSKKIPEIIELLGAALEEKNDAFSSIVNLIDGSIEEISRTEFKREYRRHQYMNELLALKKGFIRDISTANSAGLYVWVGVAHAQMRVIEGAVTEASDLNVYELDRTAFISHTQELIEDVQDWPIEEYAKRSLLLSLGMLQQQAGAEARAQSDVELRRNIKVIVASFALEFATLDKEFETRWEKIKRWARFGYQGASVPLGLTSDAAGVAGLLPKP